MTRINVVSVEELSDQHLIAEYRELPRIFFNDRIYIGDAPEEYKLGKGHVKWAILHANYCLTRYAFICNEMKYRGFTVKYPYKALKEYAEDNQITWYSKSYLPTVKDIEINRERLKEKVHLKPDWYKWTKRDKPDYL